MKRNFLDAIYIIIALTIVILLASSLFLTPDASIKVRLVALVFALLLLLVAIVSRYFSKK